MSKKITFGGLRKFNAVMAGLHAVQALGVLLLSDPDKGIAKISTSFLRYNTETSKLELITKEIGQLHLGYLVVAFFALSAIAHTLIATVYRRRYEANLKNGMNKARWYEYALSASVMMVAIAVLSGVQDISSLIMIFALDAIMNLMGLVMEVWNQKTAKTNWLSYWIGCLAGIVPWLVFAIYVWGARSNGGQIPTFVYWIYVSIFIFFNSFAINMWLQYKKVGKWADYLYGERTYIILSLVAKSLLAWQVFGGTLRP